MKIKKLLIVKADVEEFESERVYLERVRFSTSVMSVNEDDAVEVEKILPTKLRKISEESFEYFQRNPDWKQTNPEYVPTYEEIWLYVPQEYQDTLRLHYSKLNFIAHLSDAQTKLNRTEQELSDMRKALDDFIEEYKNATWWAKLLMIFTIYDRLRLVTK